MIRYEIAPDITRTVNELAVMLFPHVKLDSVSCIRSFGSLSRGTIARCHALGKAMQLGMGRTKGFYVVEILSRRFDKLSDEEKIKVLIHELMHIPKSFGGGFRHHDYVCEKNIEREYQRYVNLKSRKYLQEKNNIKLKNDWLELTDNILKRDNNIREHEKIHELKKENNTKVHYAREKKRWFW